MCVGWRGDLLNGEAGEALLVGPMLLFDIIEDGLLVEPDPKDEDLELHDAALRDRVDLGGKLKTLGAGPEDPEDDPEGESWASIHPGIHD